VTESRRTRRDVLKLGGAIAASALLAACGAQAPTAAPTPAPAAAPTKPAEQAAQPTAAAAGAKPAAAGGEIKFGCPGWWLSLLPWTYPAVDDYNSANASKPPIKIVRGDWDLTKVALEYRGGTYSYDFYTGNTAFVDGLRMTATQAFQNWDDYMPADIKSDIYDVYVKESTIDGKIWYWPSHAETPVLHYRKSYLKAAGLDAPADNYTDLEGQLAKIEQTARTAEGKPVRGIALDAITWRLWLSMAYNLAGDELFDQDKYPKTDHPAAVQALEEAKKLNAYSPPEVLLGTTAIRDAFSAGQVAILWGLGDQRAASKVFGENDWAFKRLPKFGDAKAPAVSMTWSSGFNLFKLSKNRDQVVDFMIWLTKSPDYFKNMVLQAQFLPTFKHVYTQDWVPQWPKDHIQNCAAASFIPNSVYFLTFHKHFMNGQKDFLQGKIATARDALAQIQKNFKEELAKMG
jgi:ABC-type glycerol-3-phosphate transport system substrate-binding protein